MLTKQTYLTQTGPGIRRPVLYFQGKNQLESQSAEIYMLSSKDLRVLLGSRGSEILGSTKYLSAGSANNPIRAQKVTTGKTATKTNP